jgi:hypothetical protein
MEELFAAELATRAATEAKQAEVAAAAVFDGPALLALLRYAPAVFTSSGCAGGGWHPLFTWWGGLNADTTYAVARVAWVAGTKPRV